jgi:hypothetical protein
MSCTSIRVFQLVVTLATASTLQLTDASTGLTGVMNLAAGVPLMFNYSSLPHFVCATGDDFKIVLAGSVQCSGAVWYVQS